MDDLIKALPKLLRVAGEAEEVSEVAAFVAWRRVAGEALRGCAVPFRLYRKTLIVAVPDTTWKKQLEAVSGQLIFGINSLVGQALVTFVEFRVDAQTVKKERARMKLSAADRAISQERALDNAVELQEAATAIHDDALRRRFLIAAGSYMNAQERKP
ncbi:MAG TPA: DUF721 domain-containing protein [Pyrinomonadaceae bacterium]|jgi:hypothetical protein|nr:DUF721 domain-containing protein [Pyrinomonadaceae bacterium]